MSITARYDSRLYTLEEQLRATGREDVPTCTESGHLGVNSAKNLFIPSCLLASVGCWPALT